MLLHRRVRSVFDGPLAEQSFRNLAVGELSGVLSQGLDLEIEGCVIIISPIVPTARERVARWGMARAVLVGTSNRPRQYRL